MLTLALTELRVFTCTTRVAGTKIGIFVYHHLILGPRFDSRLV